MLEIYLKTIAEIRNKVLSLIEKERTTDFNGQNNTESLMRLTEFALSETDRLFQLAAGLPGEDEMLYRCKFLMVEALEDLRLSFEERYSGGPAPGRHVLAD